MSHPDTPHPGSAPCPAAFLPGDGGTDTVVVVQILEVNPNTDLEGDDDFVPFYDNHADIYGFVTIDGNEFELPIIKDDDHPHWEATGARSGMFEQTVSTSPVPISIDIWEGDSGLTFDDDHVDINPIPGKKQLEFEFDLCALRLSGDVTGSPQGRLESSGGSGKDAATIVFNVGLKNGRPPTQDDLALIDVDLIQVVPRVRRLIARKPTVAMVRLANNHTFDITTDVRVDVSGSGVNFQETRTVTILEGEVKKEYFFNSNPMTFPASDEAYPVALIASVDDPGSDTLPAGDCRINNDRIANRITWKVVTTKLDLHLEWAKVGTLLDVGNFAPTSHFDEIVELGAPYIDAVYPIAAADHDKMGVDLPPPPITAASDWLVSVLSAFKIPADSIEPIVLTFELNAVAALLGWDRLMGVLPGHDWFERFSFWDDIGGFSLGEFAPRAVIFRPRLPNGPQMTLPAHELGHTFGLSVDSRLKTSWISDIDWPVVGSAPSGIVGGFDEYEHSDEVLQDGNPANGYWIAFAPLPQALQPLVDREQCDSHCFMGRSPENAHVEWANRGRWIDSADYDELIDKLVSHPDPEVIFVSGMISWHDQIYLGQWLRSDGGVPDHTATVGMYSFRYVDGTGGFLGEVALPVAWNSAEFRKPVPITFFAVTIEVPDRATSIEIWNRGTGTLLAERDIDLSIPKVHLEEPEYVGDDVLSLRWRGNDAEGSELAYTVVICPDGERWWPVLNGTLTTELDLRLDSLPNGQYRAKVLAMNSVRVGASNVVSISVRGR